MHGQALALSKTMRMPLVLILSKRRMRFLLGHSRIPLRHLHILVTEHLADGLHRHTSLQRNEAGERVSSRMVGIGLARFRQLADGDEIDTNTIRAQQWEKGISCPVLVFRHQLQRLGQEFHPGKCSGLLAVIDEPFVAILQHLDIGFRDGNGVYEGCSCIAGEKKQVTANG